MYHAHGARIVRGARRSAARAGAGLIAVIAVSMLIAGAAEAAEFRSVHGKVLVNHGAGFRSIDGIARLKAGDAAIAAPRGLGRLSYEDGCIVDVVPGMVAWIGQQSPCASVGGLVPPQGPAPTVKPRTTFDRDWLTDGTAMIDSRKLPAGP